MVKFLDKYALILKLCFSLILSLIQVHSAEKLVGCSRDKCIDIAFNAMRLFKSIENMDQKKFSDAMKDFELSENDLMINIDTLIRAIHLNDYFLKQNLLLSGYVEDVLLESDFKFKLVNSLLKKKTFLLLKI